MTAPDQEFVKGTKRAEAKPDGRAADVVPAKPAEVIAEIISLQALPVGRALALPLMPGAELVQGMPVVSQRVNGRAAFRSEMLEEEFDRFVRRASGLW